MWNNKTTPKFTEMLDIEEKTPISIISSLKVYDTEVSIPIIYGMNLQTLSASQPPYHPLIHQHHHAAQVSSVGDR